MEIVRGFDEHGDYPSEALGRLKELVVCSIRQGDERFKGVVAESSSMQALYALSTLYASNHCPVLIGGPSGSGKEIVAKTLHLLSPRSGKPFVPVNCANLQDALLESELFGHERGAFTDARERKTGLVDSAKDGTIFLDEVACMSPRVQSQVLRFLQSGEYRPLGSNAFHHSQARIVVATNASLLTMVREGTFREDLYYRLNAFPLEVPSLSQRKEDIPHLARHFLLTLSSDFVDPPISFSEDALHYLQELPWETLNNVRGLKNLIRRLCVLGKTFCPEGMVDRRMIDFALLLEPKAEPHVTDPASVSRPFFEQTVQARDPLLASSSEDTFRREVDAVVVEVADLIGNALVGNNYSIDLRRVELLFRNEVMRVLYGHRDIFIRDIAFKIGFTRSALIDIFSRIGLRRNKVRRTTSRRDFPKE